MITAGIDIGSITAKAALVKDKTLLGTLVIPTGYNPVKAAQTVFEQLIGNAGIAKEDVSAIVSTGYGRNSVAFADNAMTEIICHGAGAHFSNPDIKGIIDVGGQDSKAIIMDEKGRVKDFAMNDKCAAGTGRFLEVMARALEVNLDDFGKMSLNAENPSIISSICTVFAESEIISLISKGEKRENIIAGIHNSISVRVVAMAGRIGLTAPVMMTGGVAKNIGVVKALEKKTGHPIFVSKEAQIAGAIGAAIIAVDAI